MNYPVEIGGESFNITCVDMGNPHCVVFCPGWTAWMWFGSGRSLNMRPIFPDRINTEFIGW